jgi:uncharacterized membrane protein YjgN (DUF898 family)
VYMAQKADYRLDAGPSKAGGAVLPDSAAEQPSPRKTELALRFRGSSREYFRIWIVNLCLTLLTVGIFSAWAKVRKKRYIYSHTTLDGTPFQYLGRPVPILKGRIVAAIGFLLYYAAGHFIPSLMPFVLIAALAAAPWVITRSSAFNARYSAFRNMTFHFDGGYLEAAKVLYCWGIVPALVAANIFDWPEALIGTIFLVFSILFPWWIRRLKAFIIGNTSFGGRTGRLSATGRQFFNIYAVSGIIMVAIVLPTLITAGLTGLLNSYVPFLIIVYLGYVLGFAYVQANSGNLVWNNTRLGPLIFESTLKTMGLVKLYAVNALGIIASAGMLIPWAVMRTLQYRIDNLTVVLEGDLSEFQGSDTASVAAVGAETIEFFDLDLSL